MADRRVGALLVGGGAAAASCAEALYEGGFADGVLLVGREPDPPYERPPASKGYLAGSQDRGACLLHDADWYAKRSIGLAARTSVMRLDTAARAAKLSPKEEVGFGAAERAPGANVRRLRVPGAEHEVPRYGLVHLLDLPEERLEIIELVVSDGAPAAGQRVQDMDLPEGSLVISVLRGGSGFVPKADTVVEAGDEVLVVLDPGLEEDITRLVVTVT